MSDEERTIDEERTVDRRPFTARSVVASLLLGLRRPRLSGARLVTAAALLGISEGTTRVALSRMVASGELTSSQGEYHLSGALRERHGRQEEGRHPDLKVWDGSWRVAVVGSVGGPRSAPERATARRALGQLRLAEWREGLWVRPDNLVDPPPVLDGCSWMTGGRLADDAEAQALAWRLWDVEGWAAQAEDLLGALARTPPPDDLPESFRLAAAVVRHLRDDPLLPERLLPREWPGARLRMSYDRYEVAFYAALRPVLGAP